MRNRDKAETLEGLAYNLWVKRGKPIGTPEVDWRRAEELLGEIGESIRLVNAALTKVQHGPEPQNGAGNDSTSTRLPHVAPIQAASPPHTADSKPRSKKRAPKQIKAGTAVARAKKKKARKAD